MARASEWQRYQLLKGLIETAIEDASWNGSDTDAPEEYLLFISQGLDEVVCFIDQSPEQELALIEEYDGWHVETATCYEDAVSVAELYFDLR